ncbi:MAG: prepilin peptidase [Phycisphaerales bacterium]|nr:MAG: prepilin peptidase [Phycisphaerales bacterium]
MGAPDWIWFIFTFAFGCCVGSFLNVVIYRLPREKSLVRPGSACPACGRHIHFYDNIPLVSWILLGAKCRYCKARISPRYFVIELLTGLTFVAVYILYFHTEVRGNVGVEGGWLIYLLHVVLLASFIAASAIDLELWIIPLSICWLVTAIGLFASAIGPFLIHPNLIRAYSLLPVASARTGSLAVGAAVGLAISWVLLATGLLKRSYESEEPEVTDPAAQQEAEPAGESAERDEEPQFNHRKESCREILFLLPIVCCSWFAYWAAGEVEPIRVWWEGLLQHPAVAGFLGSLFGYFLGCGVVWATRILGTLGFGKEAMGLGDVHLMGAAGAVVGPLLVVLAFFIAPFFGLSWACFQMFFKKIRQIPYGPFLSLGVFAVMILQDWILTRFGFIFSY